jgi:hypothetical protein
MNTHQQNETPFENGSNDAGEQHQARGAESSNGREVHLTLQKTAELHDVSPSYLSRRVREGKSAKGQDLSEYAVIESGRVEGFRFPPDYNFPGEESGETADGRRSGGGGSGEAPEAMENCVEDRAPVDEEPVGPYEDSRHGGEDAGGFARSARGFYAGKETWGRLQRLGPEGEAKHIDYFSSEDPVTIERVSEQYGSGCYRLSRVAGGREIHFTFEISRQAPSEVERRLDKVDEMEYRARFLEEKLEKKDAEMEEVEARLMEKTDKLQKYEFRFQEERAERERVESKLEWLQEDFDQELEWEKQQLQWQKEEEVRAATRQLERKARKLEEELEEKEREHERKIQDLKHEHKLEIIRLENGREDKAIEQIGKLAEMLVEGIGNNPDVTRGLVWRSLQALGMEGLANQFMENWRQQAQTRPEQDKDRSSSNGEAKGQSRERPKGESLEAAFKTRLVETLWEGTFLGPPVEEEVWWKEVRGRFPFRPENGVHDVICPRTMPGG